MKSTIFILTIFLLVTTSGFAQSSNGSDSILANKEAEKKDDSDELPIGFKTDGCSLFPDGNYRDCCVAHDIDYYKGGKGRRASDKRLYRCVKKKKGWQNKFIAPMMFLGVRIGGISFLPTPFRWGFGKKRMKKLKRRAEEEKAKETKPKTDAGKSAKLNN